MDARPTSTTSDNVGTGPLAGVRILEMAGIGPAPFGTMMLADMGADVVRIDRPLRDSTGREPLRPEQDPRRYVTSRGRRSLVVDLRTSGGVGVVERLVQRADVLVEGFRPGVMERLGLGPGPCLRRNPRLIYARMTGWGQVGPLAEAAGHDIDYLAVAGALDNFRREGERPVPPLNLVADMGGGGMLLAFGVACALAEVARSGRGQVIDAAMVDGVAAQLVTLWAMIAQGRWQGAPGTNFADTGSPYYDVYETSDEKFVAVGAIEPQFYRALLRGLGLDESAMPAQDDRQQWPAVKELFSELFRARTRDEWAQTFAETDACVFPVLSLAESTGHPHMTGRATYIERDGLVQPAPAPRFDRTIPTLPSPPPALGEHTDEVLAELGLTPTEVATLRKEGAIA